jgi:hypothetical protein
MLNNKKLYFFSQQFHRIVFSSYNLNIKNGLLCHAFALFLCVLIFCGCKDPGHVTTVRVDHIKSITASSINPSFPPSLMLDGGPFAENAWHSAVRPGFPQWIEVEYPEPVVLDRIAIQAQYNSPGHNTENLLRAPKKITVLAQSKQSERGFDVIAEADCVFKKAGDWFAFSLPQSVNKCRVYRIIIASNYGDPDFVTIQELNFFSHE